VKQAGTAVTFQSFLTINALTIYLVSYIQDAITALKLREPIGNPDWDELRHLYTSCNGLHGKAAERRLESIIEVASGLPGIKGVVSEIRRMMSPFMAVGGRGTITIPYSCLSVMEGLTIAPSSSYTSILTACEQILAVLRGDYADEIASMKRHMPYTLGDCDFTSSLPTTIDPFKTDGIVNSNFDVLNVSGNESDESQVKHILVDEPAAAAGFLWYDPTQVIENAVVHNMFHTVVPGGVPALSFLSSSLWLADDDVLDKEFALFTPHMWGIASIPYQLTHQQMSTLVIAGDLQEHSTLDERGYLADALGLQTVSSFADSVSFYVPFAQRATLDLDACIKAVQYIVDISFDFGQVASIDELSKTSMAPVTHPAVAATR
jgi:hypothetical protein